ncbi:XdhC family protein [Nocardia sp. R7R-8]|uniref:XdhC family protein n=1 Tax=Nocardia sp. R7R-8 TaxID=3459304 RepID=UPI00403DF37A
MSAVINSDADPITVEWFSAGRTFALATVVATVGSAPLPVGSAMAVGPDGVALGGVSGGCVEGAVYESACAVRDGGVARLETFGYSDSEAFAVGLTCGGTVTVLIEPIDRGTFPQYDLVVARCASGEPLAWATTLPKGLDSTVAHQVYGADGSTSGSLGGDPIDACAAGEISAMLAAGTTGVRTLGADAPIRVFVRSITLPPRLIIFGATDHAAALAKFGRLLGLRVTVCDARPVFARPERFPDAHEVVCDWPHRYLSNTRIDAATAICVLSHDAKFDVPALLTAFATPAGYIGAMGSLRTHDDRMRRLRDAGATAQMLSRLHSPIGLDLGGKTPEETALSILSEVISVRNGRSAQPLGQRAHGSAVGA